MENKVYTIMVTGQNGETYVNSIAFKTRKDAQSWVEGFMYVIKKCSTIDKTKCRIMPVTIF
jgi:hypothetical protein